MSHWSDVVLKGINSKVTNLELPSVDHKEMRQSLKRNHRQINIESGEESNFNYLTSECGGVLHNLNINLLLVNSCF